MCHNSEEKRTDVRTAPGGSQRLAAIWRLLAKRSSNDYFSDSLEVTAEKPSFCLSVRGSPTFLRSSTVGQSRPQSATAIKSEKSPTRTLKCSIHHPAAPPTVALLHTCKVTASVCPVGVEGGGVPRPWTGPHEVSESAHLPRPSTSACAFVRRVCAESAKTHR